ncbi:MAG: hypothetical protein ABUT20_22205 [Bacteroidota bacterium]
MKAKPAYRTYWMKTIGLISFITLVLFTISCQQNTDFQKAALSTYRHDLEIGVSAKDLLTSTKYKSLVVEIQYLNSDFTPDTRVSDHLKALLEQRLNKPGGITIVTKKIQPSTQYFGIEQVKSIEETSRTEFTQGNRLAVYVLYLDGYYATDSLVLGAAYRNTSIVLFGKRINEYAAGDSLKKLVFDATIIEHEFGHLLGLVGQTTPEIAPHKDAENGNHCNNMDCLMYNTFLDSNSGDQYVGGLTAVPKLDSACVADLRGNGGK